MWRHESSHRKTLCRCLPAGGEQYVVLSGRAAKQLVSDAFLTFFFLFCMPGMHFPPGQIGVSLNCGPFALT